MKNKNGKLGREIHSTHKMSEWKSSIVTLASTPRFGSIRECEYCGGEHAMTGHGEDMHHVLRGVCSCNPALKDGDDYSI